MHDAYRFGSAEVRPAERALLIGGAPVALGGRAFDLLVALLERRGKLVTKDELLDAVWGRVIVEEGNLHVHISTLRKLLGAGLIVTIPGRGYRLETAAGAAAQPVAEAATRGGAGDFSPAGLFGRDNDLASLDSLLGAHRLVTIAGPGGIGKTRLARAAMGAARARYPDGVAMVELAALSDPALIPGAIAAALQLPLGAAGDPLATVIAAVRPLRMLLLLDNAEQVVDGVARLAQGLLQGNGAVRLLVTSQAPLKLDEERLYRLGGLEVPEPADDLRAEEALTYGAVALFDERVRAADRHFRLTDANVGAVVSICRRLDGIALALELAAARCPLLGLQMVSQHLDERFRLLRSGSRTAPSRQQTLQAAMDWSHALLSPGQQCAFRQLGVFAGGFTLDLARQVLHQPGVDEWGNVDLLAELVERSLVAVAEGEAPRYRLLETGRAYALEKLVQAGELGVLRQRHAQALR
ncbi:MAG: helix-turn-helix transcriptional regulator, partial [Burkholderiales bacterium]|nr:helix-turn-helix transcriptional regulator [Burkholderiales bacterium]